MQDGICMIQTLKLIFNINFANTSDTGNKAHQNFKSEIKALTVSNTRLKSAACLTNLHTSNTGASAARN